MVIVGLVDATRSDEGGFHHPSGSELILNAQVILARQRSVNILVEGGIESGASPGRRIEPAGDKAQGSRWEGVGQTVRQCGRGAVVQGECVRDALLYRVHKFAAADAVIKYPKAPADDHFSVGYRLPGESKARSEIILRHAVSAREIRTECSYAGRRRRVVGTKVAWHHVTDQAGARGCWAYRRSAGRCQQAWPDVGQVAVVITENAVVFPPQAEIQGELAVHLPIILNVPTLVALAVAVNDPIRSAAHAEQTRDPAAEDRIVHRSWPEATRQTDQEIIEPGRDQEAAQERGKGEIPLQKLKFISRADGVLAVRPRDSVTVLHLGRGPVEGC